MVEFWYKLVSKGLKTIDEVPAKYRAEVLILLSKEQENDNNSTS